jgi:hypothetical protein
LGFQDRVEGNVKPEVTAILAVFENSLFNTLLCRVFHKSRQIEGHDTKLVIFAVIIVVYDRKCEVVTKRVDQQEFRLVP